MEEQSRQSEVANLLNQYEQEYVAARRGLTGLALGISKHRFITRKMERMGELHGRLQEIVGDEATLLIANQLAPLPDPPTQGETS